MLSTYYWDNKDIEVLYDIQEKIELWRNKEMLDSDVALFFFVYNHLRKYPNKNLERALVDGVSLDILNTFNFKKVKSKALHSLKMLCENKWNFKIIEKIPTPLEVLIYQSNGIRPVTMKYQEEFRPILAREDGLEFFLHDLEHGYMFFKCDELKLMQIGFFKNVLQSLNNGEFSKYLSDKNFKDKFDYLISDMNTHKEHYRSYLNSLLPKEDTDKFDYLF